MQHSVNACGEHFQEIIFLPGSLKLFGMDIAFGSFLLLEQIQSDMPEHSKVFWDLIFTNTTVIFVESDI